MPCRGSLSWLPLAKLSDDEPRCLSRTSSGPMDSIKEMEQAFGVSYPTIKARLNKIGGQLQFVEVTPISKREEIVSQLERGEITAKEAAEKLRK